MSNPGEADATAITASQDLVAWFEAGIKPRTAFTIGTEHEAFGFRLGHGHAPPAYAPADGSAGIKAMLETIQSAERMAPITDAGNVIGLKAADGASLSLEPGGQFELSGATQPDLHAAKAELDRHVERIRATAPGLGLGFAPLGFHPTAARGDMPFMPKGRYRIMRDYMPKVGTRGLDMMLRTCTVQVNLDFSSEADMVTKLRVGYALQPLATALFANSPFYEGKPNGLLSNRAEVWTDTDNARAGIPAVVFEDGFGFERYTDWLLDVPMYFVVRDGAYHDAAGTSFRDFLSGTNPALPGLRPTIGDFADHATTAFPDVRLKRYIETRGADSGSPAMMLAQSAFWTGLFYDDAALAAAAALTAGVTQADIAATRAAVPREGLAASLAGTPLRTLARDAVAIATQGLAARNRTNPAGDTEAVFLAPLQDIAAGAPTQAEAWLTRYNGDWHGDITRIFSEASF